MKLAILLLLFVCVSFEEELMTGHLKPIGEQRPVEGNIEILPDFPEPEVFFDTYVVGNKPVLFKGAANNIPAFKLWTDEYMEKNFGDVKCEVEEGKKENRSLGMYQWNYKKFLQKYKTDDIYMVNTLKDKMLADLSLLPSLSCGGFDHVLNSVVMWFSSGGTKSVLHHDHVDNINCLFSGVKELYMVDQKYEEHIDFDSTDRSHSLVDVDAVDLHKYPGIAKAPWWKAKMEAGDCLFIPYRWFHQVRSEAVDNRNMAVNLWFYNLKQINRTDCKNNPKKGKYTPLDQVNIGGIEIVRYILLLDLQGETSVSMKDMSERLRKHSPYRLGRKDMAKLYRLLDQNQDKMVTVEEIKSLSEEDLNSFIQIMPGTELGTSQEEDIEDEENVEEYERDLKEEL